MRFGFLFAAATCCSAFACVPYDSDGYEIDSGDAAAVVHCPTLAPCSISETSCQQDVLRLTACVREEAPPPLPSVRLITRDQLREERAREPSPEPTRRAIAHRDALAALQLVAADTSLADAQRKYTGDATAAFYRLDEKDITVVSGVDKSEQDAMNDLSHELTHYLQDRAGQLEGFVGPFASSDAQLTRRALIEGDATVTSLRASVAMLGLTITRDGWLGLAQSLNDDLDEETDHTESPFLSAWNMLPYSLSLRALTAAWNMGGRAQVDAFYDQAPATARDWLVSGPEPTSLAPAALRCNPPLAPEGYELLSVDTLGIAGLYALLGAAEHASIYSTADWKQDVIAIYAEKTSGEQFNTLVAWRIRFGTERRAESFANSIASLGLSVTRDADELTIRASSGSTDMLTDEELSACPSIEELNDSVTPDRP